MRGAPQQRAAHGGLDLRGINTDHAAVHKKPKSPSSQASTKPQIVNAPRGVNLHRTGRAEPEPMGRESGFAVARNWSVNREEILYEKQNGWKTFGGNQVYLDIVVGGKRDQTMRLVIALFLDEVPLAAANFFALCTHHYDGLGEGGHPLTYRRSRFNRIVRGQFLQGGELSGNAAGGDSIYGSRGFEDEPFGLNLLHDAPGLVSMANHGPDTNRSQFLLTTGPCPHLDGTHVIVGRVISGAMHLPTIDALPTDAADRPALPVEIVESGAINGWHRRAGLPARARRRAGGLVSNQRGRRRGCGGAALLRRGVGRGGARQAARGGGRRLRLALHSHIQHRREYLAAGRKSN